MARRNVLRATPEDAERLLGGDIVKKRRTRELLLYMTKFNDQFDDVRRYDHLTSAKREKVRDIAEEVIRECLDLLGRESKMEFAERFYIFDKAFSFAMIVPSDLESLGQAMTQFLEYPPEEYQKRVKSMRRRIKKAKPKKNSKRFIRPT